MMATPLLAVPRGLSTVPGAAVSRLRQSSVLAKVGAAHVALLVLMLRIAPFDDRLVHGVNPWIKPMKFAISLAVYLFTMSWLLGVMPLRPRARKIATSIVAASAAIEMVLIAFQAARGVPSHFNFSTALNGVIFSVMGTAITANTAVVGALAYRSWTAPFSLPRAYLWGIRLGLLLFLLASFEGYFMVAHGASTVGVASGGPGLPVVNWSTRGGDLRIAHFLGLHALQVLPLAGYLASSPRWPARLGPAARWVVTFGIAYGAIATWLFAGAVAGRPLFAGVGT